MAVNIHSLVKAAVALCVDNHILCEAMPIDLHVFEGRCFVVTCFDDINSNLDGVSAAYVYGSQINGH